MTARARVAEAFAEASTLLRVGMVLGTMAGAFVLVTFVLTLVLAFVRSPPTLLMLRAESRHGSYEQRWVPIERISPHLRRAVMAAEDSDFCSHWGFDFGSIIEAIEKAGEGGKLRGASTLSQQTAKNLFLWPERSWVRKGLEAWFTMLIELTWSKRRTLEVYLNIAEFGDGVFGAEAASRQAFGIPAKDLSLWQASRLAVVLPAPKRRSAGALPEDLAAHADGVADGARTLEGEGRDRCIAG